MMTDTQAKQGKVKPCPNECGKDIYFESRFGPDGKIILKKDQSGTRWFMMEDVSKQQHNCPKSTYKKYDNVAVEKTQDLIQKDLLQPRTMDVVDFASDALCAEVDICIEFLKIIELRVELKLGTANGQRNGLFINNIRQMLDEKWMMNKEKKN